MAGIYNFSSVAFSPIWKKMRQWCSDYFIWSWSGLFVSGLFFGHAFVDYSFLGCFIILIGEKTKNSNLRRNAMISNAQDIFKAVLACVCELILVLVQPKWNFYMILITYASLFAGSLMLLIIPKMSVGILYLAMVALTVGRLGEIFILIFLLDHLQLEKKEQEKRVAIYRFLPRLFGVTVTISVSWVSGLQWTPFLKASTIVTGIVCLLFCSGFKYFKRLNQSSSCSRPSLNERNKEKKNQEYLRLFLRKLPLWTPILIYYVVVAAGSTFFMEQCTKLKNIGKFKFPPGETYFLVLQNCTRNIASFLADVLISKFCIGSGNQERRPKLVRMTLGMSACFGCCLVAWHFQIHRLDLVHEYPDSDPIPMSILLLAPQFSLLGLAEGLLDFYNDYVPVSMHRFRIMTFRNSLVALGKSIGMVFIHVFRFWIGDSVDSSHLQYYYLMLALLTAAATILFLILAKIYHWEIDLEEVDHDPRPDVINGTISSTTSPRMDSLEEESIIRQVDF